MSTAAVSLADILTRPDVWRGDALASSAEDGVPTGFAALDAELPGGGWQRGGLIELLTGRPGIGECALLVPALAAVAADGGWLALVAPPFVPHAPAWAAAGVPLRRLVVVAAEARDVLWGFEQVLASGAFAAVVGWPEAAGRLASRDLRRLQLATETSRTLAFAFRAQQAAAAASPAPLRLTVDAGADGLVVRLVKRRGGPLTTSLRLPLPRPGCGTAKDRVKNHVLAGPVLAAPAPRRLPARLAGIGA